MIYEAKSLNNSVCVVLQDKNYLPHQMALKEYRVKTVDVDYTYESTDGRHMETVVSRGVLLHVPNYILSYLRLITDITMIFNFEDVDNLLDYTGNKFSIS